MSDVLEGFVGRSAVHEEERMFVFDALITTGCGEFLEVGTLDGATVAWWAREWPCARFVSVDPFRAGQGTGPGNEELWHQNAQPNQSLIVGTLEEAAEELGGRTFDVIFLDGDHSYEACLSDCWNAVQYLDPAGLLLVHDYGRTHLPHLEGVTRAVDEFCAEAGFKVIEVGRTTAVLEKN